MTSLLSPSCPSLETTPVFPSPSPCLLLHSQTWHIDFDLTYSSLLFSPHTVKMALKQCLLSSSNLSSPIFSSTFSVSAKKKYLYKEKKNDRKIFFIYGHFLISAEFSIVCRKVYQMCSINWNIANCQTYTTDSTLTSFWKAAASCWRVRWSDELLLMTARSSFLSMTWMRIVSSSETHKQILIEWLFIWDLL